MRPEAAHVAPVERLLLLLGVSELTELGPDELSRVADRARLAEYAAGARLELAGAPRRAIEVVARGQIEVYRASGVEHLGPRRATGGLAELLRGAAMPLAVAAVETQTLRLEAEDVEDVLEEDFGVFISVLRTMARPLLGDPSVDTDLFARPGPRAALRPQAAAELDLVSRVGLLRETLGFAASKLDVLAELADVATAFQEQPGAPVRAVGARSDYVLVLAAGHLHCTWADRSATVRAPAALGVLDGACGQASAYRATAVTELVGLRVPTAALIDSMEDYPSLGLEFLRAVARAVPVPG